MCVREAQKAIITTRLSTLPSPERSSFVAVPPVAIFKIAKLYCAHQNCSAKKFK